MAHESYEATCIQFIFEKTISLEEKPEGREYAKNGIEIKLDLREKKNGNGESDEAYKVPK